jgi:hypothetical protein
MQNENGIGTGTCSRERQEWEVGGRTYATFREYVEACDRRFAEFVRRSGIEEELPERVIPEGATPENYDPEPEWRLTAGIDEAFEQRFRLVTAGQLNSDQYETRYLIPGILAAGQPGGIFGGFKTLKTSLAADLAISLASGTPFLGRFPVAEPGKVLFLSGEAGLPAVRSIARRICAERGLSLESLDNFVVSPDLPRLDRPVDLMILEELIRKQNAVCVVIDPAYLAIDVKHSRNLFAMGAMLRPLAELCESTGCSILLVHHAKRSHKAGSPPTLDDVAWSGFAEFSHQWLLVSRRRAYNPDTGHHELWLSAGSRAGNHGLWALDVDEGSTPPLPDNGPIITTHNARLAWKTTLRSVAWAEAQADEQSVATGEDRRLRRRALTVERQGQRVLELLAAHPDGCSARFMRDVLGLSGDRMSRLLDALVKKGVVLKCEEKLDRRRTAVTYLRSEMIDLSEAAIKTGRITQPDEKVYDTKTGQFMDRVNSGSRDNAPPPGAVGLGDGWILWPAARRHRDESAMGRDTSFHRENGGNLVPTQLRREAESSVPLTSAPAAPGPGASPLAGRDASFHRENSVDSSPAQLWVAGGAPRSGSPRASDIPASPGTQE